MIYKKFQDLQLSSLGMGCMRLPLLQDSKQIDIIAVKQMVKYAMDNGINYFDTAWGYHDGQSEKVMGEVLSDYPRETFYLASKFPGYDSTTLSRPQEIFEEQLKRCKTDYFDFYMFHNVCESNIDGYLDEKYGIFDFLMQQKRQGKIRHLGFSTHGTLDTMNRFMDAYGAEMEFCQIQLNWLDWDFQNAKTKLELLKAKNIPVWVMEPLRGGSLCNVEDKYKDTLNQFADYTMVEWAFRFLQSIDNVVVTLSGMSNMQQLVDNISIFKQDKPLNSQQREKLLSVAKTMTSAKTLPCTSCRYCTTYCPLQLDIPWMIELYNEHVYSNGGFIAPFALRSLPEEKRPSACIACKACESVCPQNIKISEMMKDFASKIKK